MNEYTYFVAIRKKYSDGWSESPNNFADNNTWGYNTLQEAHDDISDEHIERMKRRGRGHSVSKRIFSSFRLEFYRIKTEALFTFAGCLWLAAVEGGELVDTIEYQTQET